jgi:methylenetetrahydrofolate dehydrogenase (NADP+)/methenyltetrahydrofolate cyclohydrolase
MSAAIIDGEAFAKKILADVAARVSALKTSGKKPRLAAVQIGENSASRSYIASQKKSAEEAGMLYTLDELPASVSQHELAEHVGKLDRDPSIHGIIVQMPLPAGIDRHAIYDKISPAKDAEGVTPRNLGKIFSQTTGPLPCTAVAALELAKSTGIPLRGAYAVVVGHSEIVGKPLSAMLLCEDATVTTCHIFTPNISVFTKQADFLFVAAGAAQARWNAYKKELADFEAGKGKKPLVPDLGPLVRADMLKKGAVVIDIGVNRIPAGFTDAGEPVRRPDGKISIITTGDVDFEHAKEVASFITPCLGGVGPVTVAVLLRNVMAAAEI